MIALFLILKVSDNFSVLIANPPYMDIEGYCYCCCCYSYCCYNINYYYISCPTLKGVSL